MLQGQLEKLRENLSLFYSDFDLPNHFKYAVNYPDIYCHSDAIFDYLKSKGIIITNFKYANYDTLMNRIVITANRTKEDLEQLKSALQQFEKESF